MRSYLDYVFRKSVNLSANLAAGRDRVLSVLDLCLQKTGYE